MLHLLRSIILSALAWIVNVQCAWCARTRRNEEVDGAVVVVVCVTIVQCIYDSMHNVCYGWTKTKQQQHQQQQQLQRNGFELEIFVNYIFHYDKIHNSFAFVHTFSVSHSSCLCANQTNGRIFCFCWFPQISVKILFVEELGCVCFCRVWRNNLTRSNKADSLQQSKPLCASNQHT